MTKGATHDLKKGKPEDLCKNGRPFTLAPLRHTKVLHFIRHGQGQHNVAVGEAGGNHDIYKSWKYEDAPITKIGWDQGAALKAHIKTQPEKMPIELVVVSPLTRTLQTAAAVFGSGRTGEDPPSCWSIFSSGPAAGEGEVLVSNQSMEDSTHRNPYGGAILKPTTLPIIAHEECREMIGVHPCDKRRCLSHYRAAFPGVDFSLVKDEDDVRWQSNVRETYPEIQARARRFLQFLAARPETNIAIVTHSAFLSRGLLPLFGYDYHDSVRQELQEHFDNCEMRSLIMVDGQGNHRLDQGEDTMWFKGGTQGDEEYL